MPFLTFRAHNFIGRSESSYFSGNIALPKFWDKWSLSNQEVSLLFNAMHDVSINFVFNVHSNRCDGCLQGRYRVANGTTDGQSYDETNGITGVITDSFKDCQVCPHGKFQMKLEQC